MITKTYKRLTNLKMKIWIMLMMNLMEGKIKMKDFKTNMMSVLLQLKFKNLKIFLKIHWFMIC